VAGSRRRGRDAAPLVDDALVTTTGPPVDGEAGSPSTADVRPSHRQEHPPDTPTS